MLRGYNLAKILISPIATGLRDGQTLGCVWASIRTSLGRVIDGSLIKISAIAWSAKCDPVAVERPSGQRLIRDANRSPGKKFHLERQAHANLRMRGY
jgi:hypothetical protein